MSLDALTPPLLLGRKVVVGEVTHRVICPLSPSCLSSQRGGGGAVRQTEKQGA